MWVADSRGSAPYWRWSPTIVIPRTSIYPVPNPKRFDAPTRWPILTSSPWVRRYLHVRLLVLLPTTSRHTATAVAGAGGSVLRGSTDPTQAGVGSYEPACPSMSRHGLGDRAEQAPVIIGERRPGIAPAVSLLPYLRPQVTRAMRRKLPVRR